MRQGRIGLSWAKTRVTFFFQKWTALVAKHNHEEIVCAHCGAMVSADANACPECGSDENTGWSEDADKWTADIPTGYAQYDEFDYESFINREFPRERNRVLGIPIWALILLLLFMILAGVLVLQFIPM